MYVAALADSVCRDASTKYVMKIVETPSFVATVAQCRAAKYAHLVKNSVRIDVCITSVPRSAVNHALHVRSPVATDVSILDARRNADSCVTESPAWSHVNCICHAAMTVWDSVGNLALPVSSVNQNTTRRSFTPAKKLRKMLNGFFSTTVNM